MQLRIAIYIGVDQQESTINLETIYLSIVLAVVHMVIEYMILKIESLVFQESLINYFIVCYSGRLSWVPFIHQLQGDNLQHFLS